MKMLMSESRQKYSIFVGIMLGVIILAGCEKRDVYVPERKVTLDDYFDYQTTKVVQLNVEYEVGGKVLFELYGENPMKVVNGRVQKDTNLVALAKGRTDDNGQYSLKAILPASVKDVYIYSPSFGAPILFKTNVTDNAIRAKINFESAIELTDLVAGSRSVSTRASWNFIEKYIPLKLGDWNANGKPNILDEEARIVVDKKMRSYIDTYLEENGGNGKYKPYITDDADITLYKETSKVMINYVGGETSAQSVFAYYCYPKDATIDEIKKAAANACVIFPNANSKALGKNSGVAVNLKYITPEGKISDVNFPENTKIGFVIWNEGWVGKAFNKDVVYYSTKALNAIDFSCTAVLKIEDNDGKSYNVIGFEDWPAGVLDYNDVVLAITTNPADAVIVPPVPEPEPEGYTETYQGLLAFEDCWPNQGDYDLNDVVMIYNSNVNCNAKNQILSITDKFTLTWSGANLRNGFGYQLPFNMDGKKVIFSGKGSINDNVIMLFNDAKKELKVENVSGKDMPSANPQSVTYTVTIVFDVPMSKENIFPPYNPFVVINGGTTEVHLTNNAPTANATNHFPSGADISNGISTWFVCEDGFPFAIHMDARQDQSLMKLNLKPETVRIDKTYPGFADWAKDRNPVIKWW